jgi:hypothetical protein
MAEHCFVKSGSNPPVCDVHNVLLVQHQTAREGHPGGVGLFAFLVCPVSGKVVDLPATHL